MKKQLRIHKIISSLLISSAVATAGVSALADDEDENIAPQNTEASGEATDAGSSSEPEEGDRASGTVEESVKSSSSEPEEGDRASGTVEESDCISEEGTACGVEGDPNPEGPGPDASDGVAGENIAEEEGDNER